MSSFVQKIVNEFKRLHESKYSLTIPDDWLSQCAEFISEEFPGKPINEYIDLVFTQLLDYDLTVIGTECLKGNFLNSSNGILNGCFFLQIKYCADSTDSLFSRIQKLRGIVSENALVDADNVPTATQFERKDFKKNRMLAIYLTDGKHSITAIENRSIPFLNEDILPGTKVEISGRLPFENNVLLLEPHNIKVLGGNVEEIGTIDYMLHLIEEDIAKKSRNQTSAQREKSKTFDTSSNNYHQSEYNQSKNNFKNEKVTQNSYSQIHENKQNLKNLEDSDEDNLLMNCDLNHYEIKKESLNSKSLSRNTYVKEENPSIKRPPSTDGLSNYSKTTTQNSYLKKQKIKDMVEINEEDDFKSLKNKNMNNFQSSANENHQDFDLLQVDERNLKSNKHNKNSNQQQQPQHQKKFDYGNKENNFDDTSDEFDNFLNSAPISETRNILQNSYTKISMLTDSSFLNQCCSKNKPFQNSEEMINLSTCTHVINKCFFKQVISQLRQFKLRWYQEIIVTDGSTEMMCYIDNEPLGQLLDLSCKEAKDLFFKAKETGDQKYQQIFEQKRKNCEQKLRTMTAQMSFKYDFEKNKFCIFKMDNIEYNRV